MLSEWSLEERVAKGRLGSCVCPAPPPCRIHQGLPLWRVMDRLVQASPGMQALQGLLAQGLRSTLQVLPQAQRVVAPSGVQVFWLYHCNPHWTNNCNILYICNPNAGHCLPFPFWCPSLLCRVPSLSRGVGSLLLSSLKGGSGLPSRGNCVPGMGQGERNAPFQGWISLQKPAEAPTYNSPWGYEGNASPAVQCYSTVLIQKWCQM